tara:strand:+ start:3492 stop:5192 length:1701 start_codon:yes stop_codon:yes gene_type:complete
MTQKLNIDIVARDKTKQALNNVQGALAKVKGAVFNLQNAFIGLGAGLVIRNLVSTGRELENLQVRLKFLLKDTNEGAKAFDNMVKFASRVPFSLEEIQSGSGILATVTDNAKDLQNMLEITGNVAAVTGLDFRTTAEQIQRSFSAGIGAADLFREKGVRNMLGFQAGAAVSIEATAEAFQKVFGRGGRFGQATDDLANTFEGTISMLNDKVFSFKKTLLDAGFFAELKKQFGDLDEFLNDNAEQLEQIAITIGTNLAQGTIKAAEGIKILADSFRDFQTILGLVLFALGGFTMKLAGAALVIDDINRRIRKLTGETVIEFEKIAKFEHELSIPLKNLKEEAELALVPIREFEHELSVGVPTATQKAISKFRQLNSSAVTNLENKFKNIRMTIAEGINNGITKMSQSIARAFVFGEKLSDTFKNIARSLLVNIIGALIEIVARKGVELAIEKLITREKQKQAALSSVSGSGSLFSTARSFLGFAKGGAVSKGQPIVVGERGAEVFVPNQTGQITQAARGTDGGMTTVNFNINTLDASGFDDLLVRNRGTITQIINNAVNERGSKNLI